MPQDPYITNQMHTTRYLIIPSGGTGDRMGASIPKQYLKLSGKTILQHTLEAMSQHVEHIIIGVSYEYRIYIEDLLLQSGLAKCVQLTPGGKTRFETVRRALLQVPDGTLVGIHDAVRPFVSKEVVDNCYKRAQEVGAAVPILPLNETIRYIPQEGDPSQPIDRAQYRLVRTPQVFWSERIKEAYEQPYRDSFTDDSSVYNQLYRELALVPDTADNIKITTPDDLYWGEHLMSTSTQERMRITNRLLKNR